MKRSIALKILEKDGKVCRKSWNKNQYWKKGQYGLVWENGANVDVNNFMMFLLDDWKEFKEN